MDCDLAAKAATRGLTKGRDTISSLNRGVEAMLWTEQGGITEDPYVWFMEREARNIVRKRLKTTDRIFSMVDWGSHGKALGRIGQHYRPSIQKMIWGESPTMEKLKRDGKAEEGKCPLCGEIDKEGHFLKCRGLQREAEIRVAVGNCKAKLRERGVNPILSYWMLEVLSGRRPEKENLRPLSLRMKVSRLYDRQSAIGWENLLNGRATVGLEELQDWWKGYKGTKGREDTRDSGETIARALAYGMLYKYEVWKVRSKKMVDTVLPAAKRTLMQRVEEARGRRLDVRAEDRNLFQERNVPTKKDSEETIKEWLRGVENSIQRRKRMEMMENRQIVDYLR